VRNFFRCTNGSMGGGVVGRGKLRSLKYVARGVRAGARAVEVGGAFFKTRVMPVVALVDSRWNRRRSILSVSSGRK